MEDLNNLFHLVQGNWEIGFLYLLKILSDISKRGLNFLEKYLDKKTEQTEKILSGLEDLKVIVKVHEAEIKNLKN